MNETGLEHLGWRNHPAPHGLPEEPLVLYKDMIMTVPQRNILRLAINNSLVPYKVWRDERFVVWYSTEYGDVQIEPDGNCK